MKVAFIASEAYPFAKTGGLGDVAGTLPKFIAKEGLKVILMLPLYKTIDRQKHGIVKTDISFNITLNGQVYPFTVYKLKDSVKCYFFHNSALFDRDYIYGPPEGGYPDNDIRFGVFSHAVLEFLRKTGFTPDIIHANDWQTSLVPVLLKDKFKYKDIFPDVKTVLTIHNIAYQGIFDKTTMEKLELGWHLFTMEKLEFWDKVNFLKGGIVFSDALTTVSPTYAKEICTPEYGYGLDGVLRTHCHKLYGILNGIDYSIWNPETDPYIYENYSYKDLANKHINKKMFLKEFNLQGEEKPLFIFINRLTYQKGVDLLIESMDKMVYELKNTANFAFLGSGEKKYNEYFKSIENKFPNIFVKIGYDEPLSRKMYAAADFLLMPSIFEPCGLNQMIAMRYGTIVVARKTGGLADTVKDISEPNGYGILFEKPDKFQFENAIDRAIDLYRDSVKFSKLCELVSTLDFSWEASAAKYIRLYESLKFG